jgi:predicted  nucleic acid-binding Zn-ribbon protein
MDTTEILRSEVDTLDGMIAQIESSIADAQESLEKFTTLRKVLSDALSDSGQLELEFVAE